MISLSSALIYNLEVRFQNSVKTIDLFVNMLFERNLVFSSVNDLLSTLHYQH